MTLGANDANLEFIDHYMESRDDCLGEFDEYGGEYGFFGYYQIPCSEWDIYRWEAGRSAREALAEKEKRAVEALTVGQLIERLKRFPADMPAVVHKFSTVYNGINQVSIAPHYNDYYDRDVVFRNEKRVDVVLIGGIS